MRKILAGLLALLPLTLSADAETWGPELIRFRLEDSATMEIMHWVSGYSYASTALYQRLGCLQPGESVGSRYLIEALNVRYAGERITAEQATSALDLALQKDRPCGT